MQKEYLHYQVQLLPGGSGDHLPLDLPYGKLLHPLLDAEWHGSLSPGEELFPEKVHFFFRISLKRQLIFNK